MDKKQMKIIFSFKFRLNHKATEATRNMNQTLSQGTVNECKMQHWFNKFPEGDESLEDGGGCGREMAVDNEISRDKSTYNGSRNRGSSSSTTFARSITYRLPFLQALGQLSAGRNL